MAEPIVTFTKGQVTRISSKKGHVYYIYGLTKGSDKETTPDMATVGTTFYLERDHILTVNGASLTEPQESYFEYDTSGGGTDVLTLNTSFAYSRIEGVYVWKIVEITEGTYTSSTENPSSTTVINSDQTVKTEKIIGELISQTIQGASKDIPHPDADQSDPSNWSELYWTGQWETVVDPDAPEEDREYDEEGNQIGPTIKVTVDGTGSWERDWIGETIPVPDEENGGRWEYTYKLTTRISYSLPTPDPKVDENWEKASVEVNDIEYYPAPPYFFFLSNETGEPVASGEKWRVDYGLRTLIGNMDGFQPHAQQWYNFKYFQEVDSSGKLTGQAESCPEWGNGLLTAVLVNKMYNYLRSEGGFEPGHPVSAGIFDGLANIINTD